MRIILVLLSLAAIAAPSMAATINLVNDGSTAAINSGTAAVPNQGLNDWRIGSGPNNVVQEVFAYRVNNGPVNAINTISADVVVQPTPDLATVTYTAPNFTLAQRYLLTGAAPTSSELQEAVTVTNTSASPITISLYEYDFFRVNGAIGGTATLLNSSTIRLVNGIPSVTVGATNIPDRYEIGLSATVVADLVSGNLTDTQSSFTSSADISFAFQWNTTINPGGTYQIGKSKLLNTGAVPEPAGASMLVLSALAGVIAARRQRSAVHPLQIVG